MSHKKIPSTNLPRAMTRRQALKTLGKGAILAATVNALPPFAKAATTSATGGVTTVVQPFSLTEVRLLDGPFLEAQKRDEAYLLRLEPDRMLHNFLANAGLTPKAPVYAGWESVATWADIRCHGHTVGHYLTAAALMHASTGHAEMKNRVDYIASELRKCQEAGKTGFVSAFPDKQAQIDNLVAGRRSTGVPWYTLHKIMAGLRDGWLFCGNQEARETLARLADWAEVTTRGMSDAQFQQMLKTEHGGMNEVLADTCALTGDPKHLALAERFCDQSVLVPMSEGRDTLNGLHSNTQIPKFAGFERLYQLTGKEEYHRAAEFFWTTVTGTRSFATGGNGDNEHFFPINEYAKHLGSAKTMETCCSYNMLRLTRILFSGNPTAAYGDYYEKTLHNAILGSQDPNTGMMTYFQSTRPGYIKLYCTPFDSFWCCTGTGIENHAKHGDSIYFHGTPGGAHADDLFVNLFIASTLDWKEEGLRVKQTTSFPETSRTRLEFTSGARRPIALQIRHPAWAEKLTVRINGAEQQEFGKPGSYIALKWAWKKGDVVDVELPMKLRMEALPGTTDTAAAVFGPIVLVGDMGHEVKPGENLHVNERTIGQDLNVPMEVPALAGDLSSIPSRIKPAGEGLTFKTDGIGRPGEVTLIPYYKAALQHYNMYWKLQNA